MSYRVIKSFSDLQDFNHVYNTGDDFPRVGTTVTQQRLDELSSSKNKRGEPLIEFVGEEKKVDKETTEDGFIYTKTEVNRMSTAELKELAKLHGVEDAYEMTGGEIKKVLIEKFGL